MSTNTAYDGCTASMLADSEARLSASESHIFGAVTRCIGHPGEWVPDREQRAIPEDMLALCRACGGRQACLLAALRGREFGYWAGTTTRDRAVMAKLGQTSTDTADWLQQLAHPVPMHLPGGASTGWYRKGCRCAGCRSCNAGQRSRERVTSSRREGCCG